MLQYFYDLQNSFIKNKKSFHMIILYYYHQGTDIVKQITTLSQKSIKKVLVQAGSLDLK